MFVSTAYENPDIAYFACGTPCTCRYQFLQILAGDGMHAPTRKMEEKMEAAIVCSPIGDAPLYW